MFMRKQDQISVLFVEKTSFKSIPLEITCPMFMKEKRKQDIIAQCVNSQLLKRYRLYILGYSLYNSGPLLMDTY